MEERKYLVYETPKGDRCGDEFVEFFDTAEEATREAESQWNHLTRSEQKKRHIYSCYVTKADLLDDAIDEDGVIDWNANAGGRDYDGCFDSEKIEEEE
jgi:hypothetical protein|nr:MAG TPA: hypothetical protein [Caudoviricetes sp.]